MADVIELIHWKDVWGNPYAKRLEIEMLQPQGKALLQRTKPKTEGKGQKSRSYYVCYDRDFVISKIVREILIPLNFSSYNEFQQFFSEVWKAYLQQRAAS